jgi:hypothetical protein
MEKQHVMTATKEPKPLKVPLTRRFIACMQSTGRVGKSTVAEGLISWLRFAEIPFSAIDGDSQHRTLYRRYPQNVDSFDPTKSVDDFATMLQALPPTPVILVDLPAQATTFFLAASERLQLLDYFDRVGIRPTLLIFTADDATAKESAANTVRFFGDRADYLLVENPARFASVGFKKTPFAQWFQERKTPTLRLPSITSGTLDAWEQLERKDKTYLSFDAARTHAAMPELSKLELDYYRNQILAQCEDYAAQILPDLKLIKNKVFRAEQLKRQPINPLEDDFFA